MALSGADRGTGGDNTAATTLAVVPASNFTAGAMAVLKVAYDNAGSGGSDNYSSISDNHGNTWTSRQNVLNDPGAANAGTCLRIFTCGQNIATLTTSSTITVTFAANVTAKVWTLDEISGGTPTYVTGGNTTAATVSPTVTSGSIASERAIIGAVGAESGTTQTVTQDADTSNGSWSTQQTTKIGSTTSGQTIASQRKIVTATATQTYNPTLSISSDTCIAWIEISELRSGSGTITATGDQTGAGFVQRSGSGTITATGSQTGAGFVQRSGSGTTTGAGSQTGAGFILDSGSGTITAVGSQTGAGFTLTSGSGTITAVGDQSGDGFAPSSGPGAGSGTITAAGSLTGDGFSPPIIWDTECSSTLVFNQDATTTESYSRDVNSVLVLTQQAVGETGVPVIMRSVSSTLLLTQSVTVANASTVPFYGTLERADNYFAQMLEGQRWLYTDYFKRTQALTSATKRIDRLNFIGEKADASQPLQFPRGTDTTVPVDIEQACYELAAVLLKGVDPDTEADNLVANIQAYGSLRSEYDRSSTLPYIKAGIPSQTAWNLLFPYLDPVRGLTLRRVS